ncbi:Inorganic pyrophosphatase/exopolyphosphatase [Synechococcus sp. RCC307]|nr:Inorganic pyrophosphatase/exopolyphosphatase [Synechococcus sp. RCC307]
MITQPMALGSRLLLAVLVLLSGCQLESFAERQARQRAGYLGEAASSQEPLVWTSRRSPDADGAIASLLAAHLYGGQARISGELTAQTQAILQRCEQSAPQRTSGLNGSAIGVVGANQGNGWDAAIAANHLVAVVDHRAPGTGNLSLPQARRIDVRPWGATTTILEEQAQRLGVVLPKPLACAALGAIVTQTQGLRSASTTPQDRQSASRLARRAGIQQAQLLTSFDLQER